MLRKRDGSSEMFYRFLTLRDGDQVENGSIKLIGSTNAAVRFGSYREILLHGPENVDVSACRALLINHDPNQLAGRIRGIGLDGERSEVSADISPDARMQSGVGVRASVKDGSLRGVSAGYIYNPEDPDDCTYDDATRTVTVKRWRLMELSLTPIPRDTDAMVRSFESALKKRHAAAPPITRQDIVMDPIKLAALYSAHPTHVALISERIASGEKDLAVIEVAIRAINAAGDEKARAQAMIQERDAMKLREQITMFAESHNMPAAEYRSEATFEAAVKRINKDKALAEEKARGQIAPLAPRVDFTADAVDRYRDAAVDAMLSRSVLKVRKQGFNGLNPYESTEKDLGMRGTFSICMMLKEAAMRTGETEAWRWSNKQCADWFRSMPRFDLASTISTRAANQAYGQFPGILGNYMDKAIALGFQSTESITYPLWCGKRPTKDFKPFSNAAVTMGNLVQTAENVAFPEITLKDMSYQNQLAMWGATVTLTYQAILSDDLGEFMRAVGMLGIVAQRTIDKQVITVLMAGPGVNGVYSNTAGWNQASLSGVDTFTGVALGTQGSLDTVRDGFRKKISPAGQFLGNIPRYLLHPIPLSQAADRATGRAMPPGEQSYLASNKARQIEPLEINYLDDPSILGNSATAYYMVGDSTSDTLSVATLEGMEVPQIAEFDPGATADRKFKAMYPFVAYIPSYTDGTSLTQGGGANIQNRPTGITRGSA